VGLSLFIRLEKEACAMRIIVSKTTNKALPEFLKYGMDLEINSELLGVKNAFKNIGLMDAIV
jgi:hypothetical protein